MAKEPFPHELSGLVDLGCLPPSFQEYPERTPVLTNEFGIVVPSPMRDCMRENCRFRDINETCRLTRHHLHSSQPFYEAAGDLAADFQDLDFLTEWKYACRHNEHHNEHIIDVPIPRPEVMKQCIAEARILRRIDGNYRDIKSAEESVDRPGRTKAEIAGLGRAKEKFIVAREHLLKNIDNIEVIPEELVTGALWMTAPSIARSRTMMSSSYVLTGNIWRQEAPVALAFADNILSQQTAA